MSVARGLGQNGGHFYSNITKPVKIDCNFIVDSTNGNGLGIRSLKSNGYIDSVFMHTTQTPATGSPNPIAGYALVRFKNNFNYYLGGFSGFVAPLTSTTTTSTTSTHAYVITSLGTASLAQWQAAGLPKGFTPAVGQGFIATATGTIGGSATVGLPAPSLIQSVSIVGDPNTTNANTNLAAYAGQSIVVAFYAPTDADTTTPVATAPTDGTVVGMSFYFDGSSVTIDGL